MVRQLSGHVIHRAPSVIDLARFPFGEKIPSDSDLCNFAPSPLAILIHEPAVPALAIFEKTPCTFSKSTHSPPMERTLFSGPFSFKIKCCLSILNNKH
jgi:hypothetical protein